MKIVISSGKGGTGKTTLSVNLANFLAEKNNVVLGDLDVEEPNSGLFINGKLLNKETKYKVIPEWIKDKCEEKDVCGNVCKFNAIASLGEELIIFPELCHSCYACGELCPSKALKMKEYPIGTVSHFKNGKLSFVEGRLNVGQEQAVPLISQTKKYINEHFPGYIKIFDSPPGTSCPVIESIKKANFLILVTEPTPFGLHDLRLSYEVVKDMNIKTGVVINRYGIGDDQVEKFCNEEGIPVIAKFRDSRKIAELYSRGDLIYDKIPEYSDELKKLTLQIVELVT